ncbi:MAG: hypothetical protein J5545_09150 [Bacteroidaceae bacterium]|nr:hypothetical protein [Bacteroidaceae bacterium]
MEILNTFIEQASNIWWGIVAAIVVIASLYFIIYALFSGSRQFSPLSFVIAVPLLPFLAFQFYLLIGAAGVKHKCSEIATWVDAFVPEQSADNNYSREDIGETARQLTATFPLAAKLIDAEVIADSKETSLGQALTHKVNKYLNWYIVRRVAWSLAFLVLAVIGIILLSPEVQSYHPRQRREQRVTRRVVRRNRY